MDGVWALRTSGRSRVIVATAPSTSWRSPTSASSSGVMPASSQGPVEDGLQPRAISVRIDGMWEAS